MCDFHLVSSPDPPRPRPVPTGRGRGGSGDETNFHLAETFLDLVSGRSANWKTAHARVGGVQPLNLEAN